MDLVVGPLERGRSEPDVEIVERKGIGHPDTICDAVAEELSVELSRFYLNRFGAILHHNVDKVLLRGGKARARFGGGDVLEPIEIYLAGRATTEAGGVAVPVEEMAVEGTRAWLGKHLHAIDPERHVRVHCLVRPGSADLTDLFGRRGSAWPPMANDTSYGVGYAPLTNLERAVLDLEGQLNAPNFVGEHPAQGEDVKIMAVRNGDALSLTVARALIASHTPSLDGYRAEKQILEDRVRATLAARWIHSDVRVNAADSADGSSVYLTVTGTSAESGDDGEVGRGNRANGLITPGRPMSLEALCGKNSVNHVGKLYNLVARAVAEDVVGNVPGARAAECYLVSRIGAPIDDPMLAHVRVATDEEIPTRTLGEILRAHLAGMRDLSRRIVAGSVRLY